MASTKMFSVKDAEIYTEIYVDKLSDVGNDNESENCDEKSDNTSNGSEIVAPRKEIVRKLLSSESEFESSDLYIVRWIICMRQFVCNDGRAK
ncbi:hypothetical protein HZH66_013997 [Vespula vulgaris]|uniref:Uncharacterized protein n=1 Tax=Vespula vulgaris TaxID=7454 RepID=A0A834MSR1_VESVU|nr:hypothetical protein HZH66_013997 [Vespula vulgaris]